MWNKIKSFKEIARCSILLILMSCMVICLVCIAALSIELLYLAVTLTIGNIFVSMLVFILGILGTVMSIIGMIVLAGSINIFRKGLQKEIKSKLNLIK